MRKTNNRLFAVSDSNKRYRNVPLSQDKKKPTSNKKGTMDILILLVAFNHTLQGWPQNAEVPAESAEDLPAIDFDLLTKVTPEDKHSRKGEQPMVGTPVTA